MTNRKKSTFVSVDEIPNGSRFDFVYNGNNYGITVENLITLFGTIGTLSQLGDPTQTPILNEDGVDKQIRNIEDGSGVKASVSPYGGVQIDHNFQQGSTGAQIIKNLTASSPTFRTLVSGTGISVAEQNGFIQIALSATPVSNKTVIVNEIEDFPSPVSGVITLEDDTEYFLTNDMSTSNRFVLGTETVVAGSDGTLITLTYTGTDTMFTSADKSNKIRDMICSCVNGKFIDVSCSACSNVFQAVSLRVLCDEIGSINGVFTASFQNIIWDVASDGLKFFGNIPVMSFFQNLGTIAAGIFLDLGTATFDGFSFTNSQGILSAGTTFISGLPDSGNINAGGLATVINTRASGAGTPLSGVAVSDSLWEFFGNNGIADSINSLLASHTSATITITAPNTPVIIGPTWTFAHESRFSGDPSGVFTYTGKGAHINLSATITADLTAGTDDCTFYFYKNGVQETGSGILREFRDGDPGNLSMVWQLNLDTNDTIAIYVENNDSTANITILNAILGVS